jgi:hypothetical protein
VEAIACEGCLAAFVQLVGVECGHAGGAIATVWESEAWQAHDARQGAAGEG